MKLYEYQGQMLLKEYGISVSEGICTDSPENVKKFAEKQEVPVVVKAQVLTGGRGKAGGIKVAATPDEAQTGADKILKMRIKSLPVKKVYVVPASNIKKEYYFSILVNRSIKKIICMFSAEGGVEIEETAKTNPEKIFQFIFEPCCEPDEIMLKKSLSAIFKEEEILSQGIFIVKRMYSLFKEKDCSLVEINPLVLTEEGKLTALDAKIVIDDNGLYRNPAIAAMRNPEESSGDEKKAREGGLSFVSLDGTIGCMVNGAGLAMGTMDLIKLFGANPANFLDIGGSSNPKKVVDALSIIMGNPKIKAILLNIFGGITRCNDIAAGLIEARKEIDIPVPMVIRLIGTNEKEGRAMLEKEGLHAYEDLVEAVKRVVHLSESGGDK